MSNPLPSSPTSEGREEFYADVYGMLAHMAARGFESSAICLKTAIESARVRELAELRASLTEAQAEIERLKAEVASGDASDGYHTHRELYAYRKAYNALLFNEWAAAGVFDVHKSWKHSDGEPCFGGGWFVVSAQTSVGQVTNHYKADDWLLFRVPEREQAALWDGHTPDTALSRLLHQAAIGSAQ